MSAVPYEHVGSISRSTSLSRSGSTEIGSNSNGDSTDGRIETIRLSDSVEDRRITADTVVFESNTGCRINIRPRHRRTNGLRRTLRRTHHYVRSSIGCRIGRTADMVVFPRRFEGWVGKQRTISAFSRHLEEFSTVGVTRTLSPHYVRCSSEGREGSSVSRNPLPITSAWKIAGPLNRSGSLALTYLCMIK